MNRGGSRNAKPTTAEHRAGWEKAGRVLDFDIAVRVMGWTPKSEPPAYDGWVSGYCYWKGEGAPTLNGGMWLEWRPSRDLGLCRVAEQRMIELGKGEDYARKLADALPNEARMSYTLFLLTASPEVKCRAMLAALAQAEGQAQGEGENGD